MVPEVLEVLGRLVVEVVEVVEVEGKVEMDPEVGSRRQSRQEMHRRSTVWLIYI